jgi:hypothetical protein
MSEIRTGRLRWLGHVERMSEITVKNMFNNTPEGKTSVGKPRNMVRRRSKSSERKLVLEKPLKNSYG